MGMPLDIVVASAVRTPVGRALKGTLRHTRPDDLAAAVLKEAVDRVPGLDPRDLDDVILGCAMPEGEQGLNIARNAILLAEFPNSVPGQTINRFCASGLQAIAHAAFAIHAGAADCVLAGGVESMSMVPMTGNKISLNPKLVDTFPEAYIAMGHTAERVAARFEVTRDMQDAFALSSHQKATAAIESKAFTEEIVPVEARTFTDDKEGTLTFSQDECPRPDTTLEALGKLRPVFTKGGTVTAGNSSPMNDGAAAVVLMSAERAKKLKVEPLGRFRGFTAVGVAPDIMGIGPVPAIQKLLAQANLDVGDIDLFEINEAFAAQAVYCQKALGIPDEKLNVNGGAIALGHPLGCTGAKLSATLLSAMKKRGAKRGIVSMCVGGGMGGAGLFEAA